MHTTYIVNLWISKIWKKNLILILAKKNAEECFGFICDDGLCIDNDKRCDRTLDCKDGEDEDDCIGGILEYLF